MQLLRWSSDSARKLYARLAETTQVSLFDAAAESVVDGVCAFAHAARGHQPRRPSDEGGGGRACSSTSSCYSMPKSFGKAQPQTSCEK